MRIVTIDQCCAQVLVDLGDDDDQLTLYANSAESTVERIINRRIFLTTDEAVTVRATVGTLLSQAYAQYDLDVANAKAMSDTRVINKMTDVAIDDLKIALSKVDKIVHGLVLDADNNVAQDIIGAVLFLVGHYYRNREEVTTGQGSAAVLVPEGASDILARYTRSSVKLLGDTYAS